jgi:hypothetical protein
VRTALGETIRIDHDARQPKRNLHKTARELASGFRRELIPGVSLREKGAFDLGGLGLSRVRSEPSRRHFSGEE